MAASTLPSSGQDCNTFVSKNPFSKQQLSACKSFSSSAALFRAIFQDHFFLLALSSLRSIVISTVKRMLDCFNPRNASVYVCPKCNRYKSVPFTCKSRFCPSCGSLYNKQRASSMAEHMFSVNHRHIVFTIPDSLRHYFLEDRSLLNLLFQASYETFSCLISSVYPKLDVRPGMISVCHTFSRSSDWNPHIHMIATMGGITKYGKWFRVSYIPFDKLRLVYQDRLLSLLRNALGPSFQSEADLLYKLYPDGFYVRGPKPPASVSHSVKALVKYVTRYIGRPCIASSRIDGYDGQFVYFHYTEHSDDKPRYEKLSAFSFILRLIQHIPDKNFKMLRYYGIYQSTAAKSERVMKALRTGQVTYLYSPSLHKERVWFSHWRGASIRSFNVDPVQCPCCNTKMLPLFYVKNGIGYWATESRLGQRIGPLNIPRGFHNTSCFGEAFPLL